MTPPSYQPTSSTTESSQSDTRREVSEYLQCLIIALYKQLDPELSCRKSYMSTCSRRIVVGGDWCNDELCSSRELPVRACIHELQFLALASEMLYKHARGIISEELSGKEQWRQPKLTITWDTYGLIKRKSMQRRLHKDGMYTLSYHR